VGKRVHEYGCKYIMQLSHSGRSKISAASRTSNNYAQSSTSTPDTFHGIVCKAMTDSGDPGRDRPLPPPARGAPGPPGSTASSCTGANGYLITQFLSSGINDRKDEYGGPLENRARFVLDIIRAIRREVGNDFPLQLKISAVDHGNALYPFEGKGNTLEESIPGLQVGRRGGGRCDPRLVRQHVPAPDQPPGGWPVEHAARWYDSLLSQGI